MSEEARARNTSRERKIWTPFFHSYSFGTVETAARVIVFGLYANSYLNGQSYLKQIEDAELLNLLTDYNNKITELTTQEQNVVADIVSKRYLTGIDKLIHDQKMATEQEKIDTENEIATAKYASLVSDRAALLTMSAKVESEREKNDARITELEALIAIEGINLSEVEIEITEKEIQSLKIDNQKLDVANDILRIQVETVTKATELLDIDVRMAGIQIDIAETERAILKIGLLENELTVARSQTQVGQAEVSVSAARVALAQSKGEDIDAENTFITQTLTTNENLSQGYKLELMDSQNKAKEHSISRGESKSEAENEIRKSISSLGRTLAERNKNIQEQIDSLRAQEIGSRAGNIWAKVRAAVAAAETLASAEITTQLTHTIQKKP